MSLKIYNAQEVLVSLAGIPLEKSGGYADGAFLRIENDSDDTTDQAGTDGEVVVSLTNDRRAVATLILMASSDGNDILAALRNRMIASKLRAGVGAFQVKDMSGRTVISAPQAWIQKPPSAEFAREAGTREWPIRLAQVTRFDGGNISALI